MRTLTGFSHLELCSNAPLIMVWQARKREDRALHSFGSLYTEHQHFQVLIIQHKNSPSSPKNPLKCVVHAEVAHTPMTPANDTAVWLNNMTRYCSFPGPRVPPSTISKVAFQTSARANYAVVNFLGSSRMLIYPTTGMYHFTLGYSRLRSSDQ